ncbi:hypothetical protein DFP74_3116 [Nocardiopsis sp. Huas11]|uniref:hypothetical protein n=1 Tax=Nocardiopsis sp. Huas11 TaxID=2183912 RepID=UPI000EB46AD7|nr:hypothetical protein [Nocardiopsis sp. Huas11]RKS07447.1 hypothetical protein DFP74_3116 [Nocardiopsis sp. Huas11]
MQRTSRTPRATRVASVPCPETPSLSSLLCLGLLVGAALTALWLLGGAPAHAESGRDVVGALPSAAPEGTAPLEGVVPDQVAEPVTTTLDTVHQRLQTGPEERADAGAALTGAARPVADVGAEVIGAVGETDRALPGTTDLADVPVLPLDEPHRPADAAVDADAGTAAGASEPASHGTDRGEDSDAPERVADAPRDLPAPVATPSDRAAAAQADAVGSHQDADAAPRAPEPRQSATGSAATTGSSPAPSPGVAGYLTSAPLTAPDSDAVRPAPRHHRAAPAAGADDPTVSPD